jgi:hypothetical protein
LLELPRPSAFPDPKNPSFHLVKGVWNTLPSLPEVPPPGFGYPLDDVSLSNPWKSLSTPNTLGLSPSELSSSKVIEKRFPFSLPLLRLVSKPPRLKNLAPTASSHSESRIPCCPRRFNSGQDPCSLGLPASGALPPSKTDSKLLSPSLPSRLFLEPDLTIKSKRDLRVFSSGRLGLLPPWGAPAPLTFLTNRMPNPFES